MILTLSEFWALLLSALSLYFKEEVDPSLRTPSTPQPDVQHNYDFIIVGAGSAGCVVANRLSENPKWKVLLIEAGGHDDYKSDIPFVAEFLMGTEKDWNYTSVPQRRACRGRDGICNYSRGRVIGGTSTINGMLYARGKRTDYDSWARFGIVGWSYEDVLPYFIKAENMTEPSLTNSKYHGTNGPLNVQYPLFVSGMRGEYIKAGEEIGWQFTDYNGEIESNVIDYGQYTMNGPIRESSSKAYLDSIRNRENLDIILDSVVTKVMIHNDEATGVEYYRGGTVYRVSARKDVILSAGTIDTPKLLMLSGIGPKEELEKHNIDLIKDLPVGSNLQEHPLVTLYYELDSSADTINLERWRSNESIQAFCQDRTGPLTETGSEATSFFNPFQNSMPPSVQVIFFGSAQSVDAGNKDIIKIQVFNVQPISTGSVKLKSNDFRDPPLIDPNFFNIEIDRIILERGVEKIFELMDTNTMSKYNPKLYTKTVQPNCQGMSGKEYIRCAIFYYSASGLHPVGTARMGPPGDERTVVNSIDLTVIGIKKLRVVDGSVLPAIIRGNTNAPIIMIAEKISTVIKNSYKGNRRVQNCRNKDNGKH